MSYDNLSSVSLNVLKFYQQLTSEERRIPFIIKFQNIQRNTTQVIICHRVKILFSRHIKSNNSATAKVKIFKNERDREEDPFHF
jgi:hypothetical protein